jgi:UDP-galactopyranose mutase
MLDYYSGRSTVNVVEMLESHDEDIRMLADFIFEKDCKPYTAKQWNLSTDEIDVSVIKRVPFALSYNETYLYDKYEFMPKDGFSAMYDNMISHDGISIELGVDALENINIDEKNRKVIYNGEIVERIIYTGAADELFSYKFGTLPYRSLIFEHKQLQTESFQNVPVVAYPQVEGYTRITEYTKMPYQYCNGWTNVAYEYPVKYDKDAEVGNEPYYPVLTEESMKMYGRYKDYAETFDNLTLCGRLADFKYYNMDQAVLRALNVANSLI